MLTYPGSWVDPAEIMVDPTKAISCEQGPQETASEGWWCVITCAPRWLLWSWRSAEPACFLQTLFWVQFKILLYKGTWTQCLALVMPQKSSAHCTLLPCLVPILPRCSHSDGLSLLVFSKLVPFSPALISILLYP